MLTASAVKALLAQQELTLNRSRCVQHRFRKTGCERCFRSCPSGAISWQEGLHWDAASCQRCLLCVAVCPTGAIKAGAVGLVTQLQSLAKQKKPVLACSGQPDTRGHARLPCLGLLADPELLLITSLAVGRPLQLNLSSCAGCPNRAILPPLKAALQQVEQLAPHLQLVETEAVLHYREAGVSRRELFGMLRSRSKQVAISLADSLQSPAEQSFGDKSLPEKRFLLLQLLNKLQPEQKEAVLSALIPAIDISAEACTGCTGCVGLCPTGALLPPTNSGNIPVGNPRNCTDCGLCSAFCRAAAIRINRSEKV